MKTIYIIYETGTNKKMGAFSKESEADELLSKLSKEK